MTTEKIEKIIPIILKNLIELLDIKKPVYYDILERDKDDGITIGALYHHKDNTIYIPCHILDFLSKEPTDSAVVKLYGVLAYEMRHCWQLMTYGDSYFKDYVNGDCGAYFGD